MSFVITSESFDNIYAKVKLASPRDRSFDFPLKSRSKNLILSFISLLFLQIFLKFDLHSLKKGSGEFAV